MSHDEGFASGMSGSHLGERFKDSLVSEREVRASGVA